MNTRIIFHMLELEKSCLCNLRSKTTNQKHIKSETKKQSNWWNSCVFDWVDWRALEIVLKRIRRDHDRWMRMTKTMNGMLPTNKWLNRFNEQTDTCHHCGEVETQTHLCCCPHELKTTARKDHPVLDASTH